MFNDDLGATSAPTLDKLEVAVFGVLLLEDDIDGKVAEVADVATNGSIEDDASASAFAFAFAADVGALVIDPSGVLLLWFG